MTDLLSELEAVVGLAEKATPGPWESASRGRYYVGQQQDEASVHGADYADIDEVSNVAPLHEADTIRGDCYMPDADLIAAAVNFLRTHHAEIAAAVRDAARSERMEDALHQIKQWSQAYPLSVFPEPDWKRAAEVLEAAGMTLDRISAANMRHVIERVQQIADTAMRAGEGQG